MAQYTLTSNLSPLKLVVQILNDLKIKIFLIKLLINKKISNIITKNIKKLK